MWSPIDADRRLPLSLLKGGADPSGSVPAPRRPEGPEGTGAGHRFRGARGHRKSDTAFGTASKMQPETRYARNGEISLAYQVFGDGPRDIVGALPFMSHLEHNWEHPALARMLRRIGSLGRVILFDQRGVGLSDPVESPPTLEERMTDMGAVMDAAGSQRAVLLGRSDGGPVAVLFAANYPERVEALLLLGTFARRTPVDDHPGGRLIDVEQLLEAIPQRWGTGSVAALSLPDVAEHEAHRLWAARLERLAASPATIERLVRASAETDVRDILPSIQVPTLVIHRTDDPFYDVACGRYLGERIPGARFVELPGRDYVAEADDILEEFAEFLTGARHSGETDRVLATVMFTDIVASTRHATELGDRRWGDLLEAHHTTVRRELQRFQGTEVDTAGDGFLATFDGPTRAIRCAEAAVQTVRSLGLEIRVGIHTGECELIDDKVRGIAVHIGARVVALADPSEVLVTTTVRELVAGSGIEFADRGKHSLRGVPGDWQVYAAGVKT
jgi:class 3 adenylate cyclase/alpha-beta hydrolase superfamily lysophospholipase